MDPLTEPVVCFQHCKKGVDVLCFRVPDTCPLCGADLETSGVMELPPFRLPTPFAQGAERPFSLLIRPTNGSFLLDYSNSSDLHVGISDSRGTVYDFDGEGLHVSTQRWSQCIPISLVPGGASVRFDWDTKLQEFSMRPEWHASQYNEETHNCFHFATSFLQYCGLTSLYPADIDTFCEELIIPRTYQAAKFIGLYRQLTHDSCIMVNRNATTDPELTDQSSKVMADPIPPNPTTNTTAEQTIAKESQDKVKHPEEIYEETETRL